MTVCVQLSPYHIKCHYKCLQMAFFLFTLVFNMCGCRFQSLSIDAQCNLFSAQGQVCRYTIIILGLIKEMFLILKCFLLMCLYACGSLI